MSRLSACYALSYLPNMHANHTNISLTGHSRKNKARKPTSKHSPCVNKSLDSEHWNQRAALYPNHFWRETGWFAHLLIHVGVSWNESESLLLSHSEAKLLRPGIDWVCKRFQKYLLRICSSFATLHWVIYLLEVLQLSRMASAMWTGLDLDCVLLWDIWICQAFK